MNHNPYSLRMLYLKSIAIILTIAAFLFPPEGAILPSVRAAAPDSWRSSATFSGVIGGCPMFPANNIWNTPINNLPVHARSDQWVNTIGRNTGFHMDFGSGTWDGGPIGIPYNIAGSSVGKVPVSFYYPGESDTGPYPIPGNPLIEYGSDHHILIVENGTCTLYELYDASYSAGAWHAGSGAIWNLNSNALRTDTWTSADAAGLPILPGLVRYDEIMSGEITHALRFTAANTNGYIWPARHRTANNPGAPQIPPMGARFRLKASYNISGYPPAMQVILQAMKTYGIILADNGSNWYVSGAPDPRWDNDMLHLLDDLTGDDFEAVDTLGLMIDYDSGAAAAGAALPTFSDVPFSHPYHNDIEILYANGLTGGCSTSPPKFCPDQIMDRAQSAVFMLRGSFGANYVPPANLEYKFNYDDWSRGTWARPWAEAMFSTGLTSGCNSSPLKYCPWVQLPREQVVIFGLKLKYGNNYLPPPATGMVFADLTDTSYYATAWAEKAYADGLIQACGSSGGRPMFCPNVLVTRGLGAYVIVRAKNLAMP
jgi:hypothetical protein